MSDRYPQGGNLFDMAKEGTKVPEDAGKPNVVPSGEGTKPIRKEQESVGGRGVQDNTLGSTTLGEVVSAAGGELPEDVGQKYSRSGGMQHGEHHRAPHGGRNMPSH
ncbi:87dc0534-46c2-419c-abad-66ee6edfdb9d [Thermothielavioides terrestris]|uniref:87dc0534-46c2-419c-abad-66ee6edfdb9d n=1 Tax=Thermothielavioides terrestris TaxID=2587410 RepID=A0A446BKP1_9PEZI|nr:87dc0534-46c2-419c-abad-66ee6edfdb9d [Thermothielavioides terrestris]